MIPDKFGLYIVLTNPVAGYARVTEAAVKLGVRVVQLRYKQDNQAEFLRLAKELRAITAGSQTLFIVNDNLEIALESEADGLHLGQEDMPIEQARVRLPGKIIGWSTHNLEQVKRANDLKPDYIGVGPVFPTPTKEKPDPTIHLWGMREMIALAQMPCVAIGGINAENLSQVLAYGAQNYAVTRAVCNATDPEEAIKKLIVK